MTPINTTMLDGTVIPKELYTRLKEVWENNPVPTLPDQPLDYEVVLFTDGIRLADSLSAILHQRPPKLRIVSSSLALDPQANLLIQNLILLGSEIFLAMPSDTRPNTRWKELLFSTSKIFIRIDDDSAILEPMGLRDLASAANTYGLAVPRVIDTYGASHHDWSLPCLAMRTETAKYHIGDAFESWDTSYPFEAMILDELLPFDAALVNTATLVTLGLRERETNTMRAGKYMQHLAVNDTQRYIETINRMSKGVSNARQK